MPRPLAVATGIVPSTPSHVIWTLVLEAKPVPEMLTDVPTGPVRGDRVIVGPEVDAKVDTTGRRSAPATMIIVAVAARSRQRELRRVGGVRSSETQWVPSQKDNVVLHSATRLTQGVPWLCGPASRRVCLFVASGLLDGLANWTKSNRSTTGREVVVTDWFHRTTWHQLSQWRGRFRVPAPKYRTDYLSPTRLRRGLV